MKKFLHLRGFAFVFTFVALSLASVLPAKGEDYTKEEITFYWSDNDRTHEIYTLPELQHYLTTRNTVDKEFIKKITYANNVGIGKDAHNGGTVNDNGMSLYSPSCDNQGKISFEIAPAYQHKAYFVFINGVTDPKSTTEEYEVCLTVNGNLSTTKKFSKNILEKDAMVTVNCGNELIRDISIELIRPEDTTDENYHLMVRALNVWYYPSQNNQATVTKLAFNDNTHTGYLDEAYELPTLVAIPEAAAKGIELESSDPEVAAINGTKVELKSVGKATITAKIPDNHAIFKPMEDLQPATYELNVMESRGSSTSIDIISDSDPAATATTRLYDLQGRQITGTPASGIYIRLTGTRAEKLIIP